MSPTEEPPRMTPQSPMTLRDVTALLRLTLTDPGGAARAVLSMGVPREHHWTLFFLAITLSGAVWQLTVLVLRPEAPEGAALPSGLTAAAVTGGSILLLSAAIRWIGRLAGGTGDIEDVLLLVIWFQFVLIALQVVEIGLMLVAPVLGTVIFVAVAVVTLWVLTHFIAVVHGFRSLGRVFLGMVLATFALAFLLSLILAPFLGAPAGA